MATKQGLSRDQILSRAQFWVERKVHYRSLTDDRWPATAPDPDGRPYRTDCSGYVAMAWRADHEPDTCDFAELGYEIAAADLLPGDAMLWPGVGGYGGDGGHVVLFAGWNDIRRRSYLAYELACDRHAALVTLPYPFRNRDARYVPWRPRAVGFDSPGFDSPGIESPGIESPGIEPPGAGIAP